MSQSATARGQWAPRSRRRPPGSRRRRPRRPRSPSVRPGPRGPGLCWRGFRMSKQPRNLNAVFGRFRRRMLAAELPTGAVERRDTGNASEPARRTMPATLPDPPPRLPVRSAWRVRPRRARRRHAPSPRWPLKLRVGPGSASAPARPRDRKEIRRSEVIAVLDRARALRVELARITDDHDEGPPFGGQRHQPRLTPGGYCTKRGVSPPPARKRRTRPSGGSKR